MRETKRVQKTPSADPLPPLPDNISIKDYIKDRYDGADDGDIFSKVEQFTLVERARELDLYPYFQPLDNNDGPVAQIYGKTVLMFGSNNYLGLTRHPYVIEKTRDAVLKFGTSMTGSRFLNGSTKMHEELEERIANFLHVEAAVIFTTGYQANLGIISTLVDKKSVAVVDKAVHASVYDGCQMSDGEMMRFRHNDADHLDQILSRTKKAALVIVDGVYSMGGDIAPLPELSAVCKKHRARLLVDDAHGLGVLGEGGRGTASHFGVEDDVDLIMGTFSKALGSIGGFVAGPHPVLGWIKHFARSMLFSASLPPASTAAALASLDVIEREPEIIDSLQEVAQRWREGLTERGFDVGQANTPIVPVNVGDEYRTIVFGKALLEAGVYTNTAVYPAVNMGEAILRTSCMATHTEEMVDEALGTFETVGRKLGVIS